MHIEDLGSLARLTYDPDSPDEFDLTLFMFPQKTKWIIGYITSLDLEDILKEANLNSRLVHIVQKILWN